MTIPAPRPPPPPYESIIYSAFSFLSWLFLAFRVFSPCMKIRIVTIQIKAIEKFFFPVVLFIMLCKVVLTFYFLTV